MTVANFVAEHKLSPQVRNHMMSFIVTPFGNSSKSLYYKKLALTVTVGNTLAFITDMPNILAKVLIRSGLTHLDLPNLPAIAMKPKVLKGLGKEALRLMDVRRLGSLSERAIYSYDPYRDSPEILTIAQVLESSPWTDDGRRLRGVLRSLQTTRVLLRTLGFGDQDGSFMSDGTRRKFIEKLILEDGLGKRQAKQVAELAEKYHWVPKFIE